MKNSIKLWKRITALCFLIIVSVNTQAQLGKKLKRDPGTQVMATKVKPAITSPTAGSVIDGPFVLVGKAAPNSTLNLTVSPIYKLPASTNGKPILVVSGLNYERQQFVVKADANGIWQSPVIRVNFDSKVTDRRIFAHVWQKFGEQIYESKNTEYFASPKLVMEKKIINIPTNEKREDGPQKDEPLIKNGENLPAFKIISPTVNKNVGKNGFYITGIAPEGALVRVDVMYSGYKSTSDISIGNIGPIFPVPKIDKNTREVNNELWGTYNVRFNKTIGMWITDEIKLVKKISVYSCWANTYTITASLINESGKPVRQIKTVAIRMDSKAINTK